MNYGNQEIGQVFYGGAEIDKIYCGSDLVYEAVAPVVPFNITTSWNGIDASPSVTYPPLGDNHFMYADNAYSVVNINEAQTVTISSSGVTWSENVNVRQQCANETTSTELVFYGALMSLQNSNRIYVDRTRLQISSGSPEFTLTNSAYVDTSDRSKASTSRCGYVDGQVLWGYSDNANKVYRLYLGNTIVKTFSKTFYGSFIQESASSVLMYTGDGLFRATASGVTQLGNPGNAPVWFDGTCVYTSPWDALLRKVDIATGDVKWSVSSEKETCKMLGEYNGSIYIVAYNYDDTNTGGIIMRIDSNTGKVTGQQPFDVSSSQRTTSYSKMNEMPIKSTNGFFGIAFQSDYSTSPYNMWLEINVAP